MDRDAMLELIEASATAASLLAAIVVTHANHMNTDQRQVIKETVADLRDAITHCKTTN